MVAVDTYPERYADPLGFAREVNLPLLGTARVRPVPAGAGLAQFLEFSSGSDALGPVIEGLSETRRSLTLRSLLLAGFPHDPECFAVGLSLGREWSRRGLKVAVVDLDFWNPTVVRPPSHPNEGLVDVLEYGCSFGRVAWEVVADRLWVIGPGSHPPDEAKIAEHPDWTRASRVFGTHVDVTLYVAPLLDRRGFTGKLSKRMDAALLAASVERIGRPDLRDSFLELWGSDAPMIGCVGIEPLPPAAPPRPSVVAAPEPAPAPARSESRPTGTTGESRERSEKRSAPPPAARRERERVVERDLEAQLDRDVRRGIVERRPTRKRSRTGLYVALGLAIAVAAGAFAVIRIAQVGPIRNAVQVNQPAGEEPVVPTPSVPAAPQANDPAAVTGQAPVRAGLGTQSGAGVVPPGGQAPAAAANGAKPFRVHVASFRSQTKVEEVVRALEAKNLEAWYEPPPRTGGWYRVFVGRFATAAEASAYAQWLLESRAVDEAQVHPQTTR